MLIGLYSYSKGAILEKKIKYEGKEYTPAELSKLDLPYGMAGKLIRDQIDVNWGVGKSTNVYSVSVMREVTYTKREIVYLDVEAVSGKKAKEQAKQACLEDGCDLYWEEYSDENIVDVEIIDAKSDRE